MTDPALWIRALTTELSRPVIARMIARQFKPMKMKDLDSGYFYGLDFSFW